MADGSDTISPGISGSRAPWSSSTAGSGTNPSPGPRRANTGAPWTRSTSRSYQLDVLFHFMPKCRLNPFIVAGYRGHRTTARKYRIKTCPPSISAWARNTGWSKHVALRVDLKDNAVGEVFKNSYQDLNATAGVVLGFGGVDKKKPAKVVKEQPKPVRKWSSSCRMRPCRRL
jgi:hypothetical protein